MLTRGTQAQRVLGALSPITSPWASCPPPTSPFSLFLGWHRTQDPASVEQPLCERAKLHKIQFSDNKDRLKIHMHS